MKKQFRLIHLSKLNKEKLSEINIIIEDYKSQGYKMTLRQLYYQLVTKNVIPNVQAEYTKLSKLLKEGRMSGIVDWDAIEDRLRVPKSVYWVNGISDALSDTISQYRLYRQKGQNIYTEVWVEKDAISNILSPITAKYGIKLLVSRGYNSVTAIHDAYERFCFELKIGKKVNILYLGDHDPSGLDMVRDIENRISLMLQSEKFFSHSDFSINHIGITMEQIKLYNPPENPAKITDPRSFDYIKQFGSNSWELDALSPDVLNELLTLKIETNMDMDLYNQILIQEEKDIKQISKVIEINKNINDDE